MPIKGSVTKLQPKVGKSVVFLYYYFFPVFVAHSCVTNYPNFGILEK